LSTFGNIRKKRQPERIDQEIFSARYFGQDVGEDQIVPAMLGIQSAAGSEVDAGLPFGGIDPVFETVWRLGEGYVHGEEPRSFYYGVFAIDTESSHPTGFVYLHWQPA
jgi:hypothetical protein